MKSTSLLKFLAAAIIVAGPVAAHAGVPVAPQAQAVPAAAQTDRLIVKYKDAVADGKGAPRVPAMNPARKAILDRAGQQFGLAMQVLRTTGTGAHVMQLDRKLALADVRALAAELKARDPNVEYAEPDRIMTRQMTPNDSLYNNQWDFYETAGGINAPAAWDKSTGAGVNVAVIDTGYRPHADLKGQILPGYDFISNTTIANDGNGRDSDASDPGDAVTAGACGNGQPAQDEPSSWHGTHVAGTIAALTNNSMGVAGVAWGAKIVPARVLGKCGGYTSDIADAMIWASGGAVSGVPNNANKARVLNLSLGGSGSCDSTTQNAINSARSRGAVVVVAAGNSNTDASTSSPANCQGVIVVAAVGRTGGKALPPVRPTAASTSSPANCQGVIVVAAVGRTGGKASYSNTGSIVDVAAPGGDSGAGILSTLNSGTTSPASDNYAYYMGTSMATPHVAGVAALMLSKNPNLTPDEVESKLKSTARAFPAACSGCGTGIVNALAAVNAAISATTTAPTISETESNDTMSTANAVATSGTTVNGNMGSNTDNDYFLVQLPAGKTLSATLAEGSTSDYDLYVYNASGSQLATSQNGAGSTDTVSSANTTTSTSARYVRVRYYSGGTGSTYGKYTLKLSW